MDNQNNTFSNGNVSVDNQMNNAFNNMNGSANNVMNTTVNSTMTNMQGGQNANVNSSGPKNSDDYVYDAFISYRHAEVDKFVAENLHRRLEAFRLPKSVLKKKDVLRKRIKRVFRDEDELPLANNLEDPIVDALSKSDFLIVICSPRLKESMWCRKEIETFIKLHGREHILAVLVEGEPEDSFPEELLHSEETIWKPDGTREVIRKNIEPLAADVRGKSKREMLKAMDIEILRLLAPMFGLNFDDLKQRHREQKMKRIVGWVSFAGVIGLLFGLVGTIAAIMINNQKNQIAEQSERISAQADEIATQAMEISSQNSTLKLAQALNLAKASSDDYAADNRPDAIQNAVYALTEYDGVEMPYTEEAQYALSQALHVYNTGNSLRANWQITTVGAVESMKVSADGKYLAVLDSAHKLYLWDVTSRSIKNVFTVSDYSNISNSYDFLPDNSVVFINQDKKYAFYNPETSSGTVTNQECLDTQLHVDSQGKYIYAYDWDEICRYDIYNQTLERYPGSSENWFSEMYFDAEDTYCAAVISEMLSDEYVIDFFDTRTMNVKSTVSVTSDLLSTIYMVDNYAYIVTAEYGELLHTDSTIHKVDIETGEMLWSTKVPGVLIHEVSLAYDPNKLIYLTYSEVGRIGVDTGKQIDARDTDDGIVGYSTLDGHDYVHVFLSNGELAYINFDLEWVMIDPTSLYCNCNRLEKVIRVAGGFIVQPYNDNRVILYSYTMGPDVHESDVEYVDHSGEESFLYNQAVEEAKRRGIVEAELVTSLFYNDDESVMFVQYISRTMEVYKTSNMELLASFELDANASASTTAFDYYAGTDKYGNYYIGNGFEGYMLSPNYKPIAFIEQFNGVDGDRIYLGNEDQMYEAPIYTYEQLLKMAD